jgi:1-hydroxy-2-isopentenylcarotenoid 3,4-desaturase
LRRTVGPADFQNDLNAWKGNALGPAHTLMQSAVFRAGNVSKKIDDLYYVGSSTIPGIGLPMCLISAEVLLKRLRGDVSANAFARRGDRHLAQPRIWKIVNIVNSTFCRKSVRVIEPNHSNELCQKQYCGCNIKENV